MIDCLIKFTSLTMSEEKVKKVVPEKAIGYKTTGPIFELSEKDVLLYAVGIGFSLGNSRCT